MLKEEKFEINASSVGITEADGDGTNYKDIWDFKPPVNTWVLLSPNDVFSAYLVGDDTVEMPASTKVRIVRRDVTNEAGGPILGEVLYQLAKEFTDKNKLLHLSIGSMVQVGPEEHIVVQVAGADAATTGDLDASLCRFKLKTTRRKVSLA